MVGGGGDFSSYTDITLTVVISRALAKNTNEQQKHCAPHAAYDVFQNIFV